MNGFWPAASRRVRTRPACPNEARQRRAYLLVYNAELDKASGKPQLRTQVRLFRDGKQVFAGNELPLDPTVQTDLGRLVVGGALELGTDLQPGEYIFQIIVSDTLADKKYRVATQWMDFEIGK